MARFLPEMGQSRIPRRNRSESDHVTGEKTGRTTLLTSDLSLIRMALSCDFLIANHAAVYPEAVTHSVMTAQTFTKIVFMNVQR